MRLALPAVLAGILLAACTGGSNGAPTIRLDALSPIGCVALPGTSGGFDCATALDVTASGGREGALVQGQISAVSIGGLIDSSAETWSGAGAYRLPFRWNAPACSDGSVDLGIYAAVLLPTANGSFAIGAAVETTGFAAARTCS